jgi:hypothetical protein
MGLMLTQLWKSWSGRVPERAMGLSEVERRKKEFMEITKELMRPEMKEQRDEVFGLVANALIGKGPI